MNPDRILPEELQQSFMFAPFLGFHVSKAVNKNNRQVLMETKKLAN